MENNIYKRTIYEYWLSFRYNHVGSGSPREQYISLMNKIRIIKMKSIYLNILKPNNVYICKDTFDTTIFKQNNYVVRYKFIHVHITK